jgi:hypothetical protein
MLGRTVGLVLRCQLCVCMLLSGLYAVQPDSCVGVAEALTCPWCMFKDKDCEDDGACDNGEDECTDSCSTEEDVLAGNCCPAGACSGNNNESCGAEHCQLLPGFSCTDSTETDGCGDYQPMECGMKTPYTVGCVKIGDCESCGDRSDC